MKYIFVLAACFLFACSNPEKTETVQPDQTQTDSSAPVAEKRTEPDFLSICASITSSNVQDYISAENGVWVITSPGVMPTMQNIKGADGKFNIDFSNMKEEEVAKVDCDSKTLWTKTGCYTQEVNTFKDEKIWKHCGLTPEDESKVEQLAQTISRTVVNTAIGFFYFSKIDGKWYITFMDLRKPCEA